MHASHARHAHARACHSTCVHAPTHIPRIVKPDCLQLQQLRESLEHPKQQPSPFGCAQTCVKHEAAAGPIRGRHGWRQADPQVGSGRTLRLDEHLCCMRRGMHALSAGKLTASGMGMPCLAGLGWAGLGSPPAGMHARRHLLPAHACTSAQRGCSAAKAFGAFVDEKHAHRFLG
eukprot:364557-Chlamydomonas_euryale.AAC.43